MSVVSVQQIGNQPFRVCNVFCKVVRFQMAVVKVAVQDSGGLRPFPQIQSDVMIVPEVVH